MNEEPTDIDLSKLFPNCWELVQKDLLPYRDRCRHLANSYRIWFRISGIVVISLSVGLPLVTTLQLNPIILSILSLTIALATGLRTFYNWDAMWRSFRSLELAVTYMITRWQVDLLRISKDEPITRHKEALARTQELLEEAYKTIEREFQRNFGSLKWPDQLPRS